MTVIKQKILDVLRNNPLGVLSTVTEKGGPSGRYMVVHADETLTLFAITSLSSRKVSQIRKNPRIHLTAGCVAPNAMGPWICYSGTASILNDQKNRHAFWKEEFKQYFKDADDPDYCIIRMEPETIEYWAGWEPEIWSKEAE